MPFQRLANAKLVIRPFEASNVDEIVSYFNCMAITGRHTIADTPENFVINSMKI